MAKVILQISPTPNPNAIRIGVSTVISDKPLTFNSTAAAEGNPLAKRLFAVKGVASVFFMNNFLSVTKEAGADWGDLEPRLAQAVEAHFNG